MKKKVSSILFLCIFFLCGVTLYANDYKVVVGQLSPLTMETFKNLATSVVEATGNKIAIEIVPPARGIYLIENKQADFYTAIIAITDPKKIADLKYDYSTADTHNVVFVLYTNKKKPIDPADLKKGNPKKYKIETDISLADYFNFNIQTSTNAEGSLKKVDSGSIDGYIFSQPSTDPILKKIGAKNIVRQYYETYNGKFILPKGAKGGEIDKMISDGMAKIRANGKYQEIMGGLLAAGAKYIEWQP